jgi:hypothetical protein
LAIAVPCFRVSRKRPTKFTVFTAAFADAASEEKREFCILRFSGYTKSALQKFLRLCEIKSVLPAPFRDKIPLEKTEKLSCEIKSFRDFLRAETIFAETRAQKCCFSEKNALFFTSSHTLKLSWRPKILPGFSKS